MHTVSLTIEILRARPAIVFWAAALAQAMVWVLVPAIFYSGPPGDLPAVLAVGREFQTGSYLGPPLAFWAAQIAFLVAGSSVVGVYVLAQICVVVTYWAVFTLGRAIVGSRQAALAVMLMVGVTAFTLPTPDFGPSVLAMPLWALILLHFWRLVGEGRRVYWYAIGIEAGLLMLTTYAGALLLGLLVAFVLVNRDARKRARAVIVSMEALVALLCVVAILAPHIAWLNTNSSILRTTFTVRDISEHLIAPLRLLGSVIVAHVGLVILVLVASGWPDVKRDAAPAIMRGKLDPLARTFVYVFAVAPAGAVIMLALVSGQRDPLGGIAPLLVLSGLAIVVFAGDAIALHRQLSLNLVWGALLLFPAVMAATASAVLPWTLATDLKVALPANDMGNYFADTFQRRTGKPLAILAGDPRTASVIALAAPSGPSVYFDAAPERSPWVNAEDIKRDGAVVVWPATDTIGAPPPDIKARFPDLVPEIPRAFDRRVQGLLPPVRVGWGMIRPQGAETPATPSPAAP